MTYLKRKADLFLTEWKADADRKPLMIKGARQVGKTETIRRFGESNYSSFIEMERLRLSVGLVKAIIVVSLK